MEKLDALLRANVTLHNPQAYWHAINWRAANNRVSQLRGRIYRAPVADKATGLDELLEPYTGRARSFLFSSYSNF